MVRNSLCTSNLIPLASHLPHPMSASFAATIAGRPCTGVQPPAVLLPASARHGKPSPEARMLIRWWLSHRTPSAVVVWFVLSFRLRLSKWWMDGSCACVLVTERGTDYSVFFFFIFKKKLKFQKYMSVLENFKNIPRSPYWGATGLKCNFFSFKFTTKSLERKKGGLSPVGGATGPSPLF